MKVSDADIQEYYNTHKTQYVQPESRDVRHILVPKKALADSLYAQLKSGANFAQLAKRYSKDPGSAANGGKLTVSKGQTVPEFDKTAFSLKKGELSQPVKTQYGYHIIQALSAVKRRADDAARQGARVDPAAARAAEEERQGDEVARGHEEELLRRQDQVPGRLPAEPGSLR